jgi:hypothetical protein
LEAPVLIGVDDGYADTKIASSAGCLVVPSRGLRLDPGHDGVPAIAHTGLSGTYCVGGERIFVDPTISGLNTYFDDFHTSDLNAAFVHHALRASRFSGKQVVVAASLPLGAYYDANGRVDWDLVEAKRRSLLSPVLPEGGVEPCEIVEAHVFPQGVSAWVGTVLDSKGRMQDARHPVAVIDIGERTTDFVVILPPNRIDPSRTATVKIGISDVHEALRRELLDKHGVSAVSPLLELVVRSGTYPSGGQLIDLKVAAEKAKRELSAQIANAARAVIGREEHLDAVFFVGGGYSALPWISSEFKKAKHVESPSFANARGMWKYLKYVQYA